MRSQTTNSRSKTETSRGVVCVKQLLRYIRYGIRNYHHPVYTPTANQNESLTNEQKISTIRRGVISTVCVCGVNTEFLQHSQIGLNQTESNLKATIEAVQKAKRTR